MRGCVLKKGLFGVVSEQDELPSSVGLDFRARLDGGFFGVEVTKLTTSRLVNGSSCDGIDMVIKNLDLELKDIIAEFCGPSRWKELSKESGTAVTDSLVTIYDSADESSVCSTSLPPLKKLDGVESIYGPKTIKSILRSKSTFIAEALKSVIINEPSSAPAKGKKISSALKVHSAPAGKLKSVKIKDDPPLAICDIRNPNWISQLCDAKYIVQFDEKRGTIFNSNKEVVMIAPRVRDVYVLNMTSSAQESCFFAKASENLNWLWHKRLAHLNFKIINKLAKQNLVIGLPSLVYSKDKPCSSCEKGS
ncbi:retrovirus-related pol polyprotein from transposon TNT 1-94 [Tanacetum coccineum]